MMPSAATLKDAVARQKGIAERLLRIDADAQRAANQAANTSKVHREPAPSPAAERWDWRDRGKVTPVRDEGPCGSVWAFATIAAFESSDAIRNNTPSSDIDASEQHLLNCSGAGSCDGGWWAFDYLIAHGVTTERRLPYRAEKQQCEEIAGSYRAVAWGYVGDGAAVVPSVPDLKKALCESGPLAVAVRVTPRFTNYRSGVFDENDPGPVNHAVLLVGWDDKKGAKGAWIVKNFWGTGWGQDGYMDIAYGSNSIGYGAAWVRASEAASMPDVAKIREVIPDTRPFEVPRASPQSP
jgi:cathepsin L